MKATFFIELLKRLKAKSPKIFKKMRVYAFILSIVLISLIWAGDIFPGFVIKPALLKIFEAVSYIVVTVWGFSFIPVSNPDDLNKKK